MNQRDLKLFRKLLDEKMAELLAEADRTVDVMNGKENFPVPTDRASLTAKHPRQLELAVVRNKALEFLSMQ